MKFETLHRILIGILFLTGLLFPIKKTGVLFAVIILAIIIVVIIISFFAGKAYAEEEFNKNRYR